VRQIGECRGSLMLSYWGLELCGDLSKVETMVAELRELLGGEKVSTMGEVLEEHGKDKWNFSAG